MSVDEELMFVPSRPVPQPPPKRQSTPMGMTTAAAYEVPKTAGPRTDDSQEAPSPSSRRSSVTGDQQQQRSRRGSLSFLSRSKSHDILVTRSPSGRKMLRSKKVRDQEERLRQEQVLSTITRAPPQLPNPVPVPQINSFGGADENSHAYAQAQAQGQASVRPDSVAIISGKVHNHNYPPPPANFSRPKQQMNFSAPNPYGVPLPPMPLRSSPSMSSGTLPRTESIVSRGRESYAPSISASVNSPRRMRRRKDPEAFNVLIAGAKSSGKTSFVEFLKTSLALPPNKQMRGHTPPREQTSSESAFTPSFLESEIDRKRVGLTLWDSPGLEESVVDLQLREMTAFIESKFEETFAQESRVVRTPGVKDTHIHCVVLIIDPVRISTAIAAATASSPRKSGDSGSLEENLDFQVMRALEGKTTVIPVIAKADTLTADHMSFLKRSVWSAIQRAKLDPLEALSLEDEEEEDESEDFEAIESEMSSSESEMLPIQRSVTSKVTQNLSGDDSDVIPSSPDINTATPSRNKRLTDTFSQSSTPATDEFYIPFSILSPDPYSLAGSLTRKFPWGEADPNNPAHCDYPRLRDSIFSEWRSDLRLAAREKWYEGWRTSRLKRTPQPRIRQAGGVTPAGVVPREGRTVSPVLAQTNPVKRDRAASTAHQEMDHEDGLLERPRTLSSSGKAERVLGSPRGIAL